MKQTGKNVFLKILLLTLSAQLVVGCQAGSALFTSGLAREWKQETPVTPEQLIMEPAYYFTHLDQDIDRAAWLLIPQGRIIHKRQMRNEFLEITELLENYILILDQLPDSRQLPERQLAKTYLHLFEEVIGYFNEEKAMHEIQASLSRLEPSIHILETELEDATARRLNILVQTIGSHNPGS